MNEHDFVQQFAVVFIATYTAGIYVAACARSDYERLNNPPIEDAVHIARRQWAKIREIEPGFAE